MTCAFRGSAQLSGGDLVSISLPDDLAGSYGIVLIYRGSWCPYCSAQLASFSRADEMLAELGAKVVALSADDETNAAELGAKHKLAFPVGHSADAQKVAAATGAYVNDDPRYLQSTGFVLADGADDHWASWYAWWLINLSELPVLVETAPIRSELIYLLVSLDKQYTAEQPGEPWESCNARRILTASDEISAAG